MILYPGLTDRQNKLFHRILSLCLPGSQVTSQERGYLQETKEKILSGWDFKWSINGLNLVFKEINDGRIQNVHLSQEAKRLYQDLIDIYGEPKAEMPLPPAKNRPKFWMDSDPELVYRGYGRGGSWSRRDPELLEKSWWISYFGCLLQLLIAILLSFFFVLTTIPSVNKWLSQHFGRTVWQSFFVLIVVAFLAFEVIIGNLHRKKKK
ncbi:hypothetical protein [Lactovum odontotermitis]